MDFVKGLPSSQGKNIILVIVDRFSKYAHFVALSHPYTDPLVVRLFFVHIFKLHGLSESIVCDRDVTLTSTFGKELFRLCGTQLCFTAAYHPQLNGQTEVVNLVVKMYLRCFSGDFPKKWLSWLSCAEFCYNSGFHSSLRTTPFEVVYGRTPPHLFSYCPGLSKLEAVDHELLSRDQTLDLLRSRLLQAQNTMKTHYDSSHPEVLFQVGDHVLLRLQLHRAKGLGLVE